MMTVKEGGGHFSRRSFFFFLTDIHQWTVNFSTTFIFKVTVALSLNFISKNGFPLEI